MIKRWSVPLAAFAALSLLFLDAGVGSAKGPGGGGHGGGGGGGGHAGGGAVGGGHGGAYVGGGRGGYYGGRGGYYGGRGGYYGGIGLYVGGYPGFYYSAYDYPAVAPSVTYGAPTTIYAPSTSLYVPQGGPTAAPPAGSGPEEVPLPRPRPANDKATVEVYVPADAEVWIDDTKTKQTGTSRSFLTPDLEPGHTYVYDVRARWIEDGKEVVRKQEIRVQAGKLTHIDFVPPPEK